MTISRSVQNRPKPKPAVTTKPQISKPEAKPSTEINNSGGLENVNKTPVASDVQNASRGRAVKGDATAKAIMAQVIAAEKQNAAQGIGSATADDGFASGQAAGQSPEVVNALGQRNIYTPAAAGTLDTIKAGGDALLVRGHKGADVNETQAALNKFGLGLAEDGMFGPKTEAAVRRFQEATGLESTGRVDAKTFKALQETDPASISEKLEASRPAIEQNAPTSLGAVNSARIPTGERRQMIIDTIRNDPQIPDSWANDPTKLAAINRLVEKESGWRVGVPNYTITNAGMSGQQAAELLQTNKNLTRFGASSSAMGLFQLLGTNMDKYQPGGRAGIGNAQAELSGGLRYLVDRYGTPERALNFHNNNNWW